MDAETEGWVGSEREERVQHHEVRSLNVHLATVSICCDFGRVESPLWVSVSLSGKWESWAM